MSFINHLIKRSKEAERPCTLDVPANRVGSVVEHIIACEGMAYGDRDAVRKWLCAGSIALHGCMLRVVGEKGPPPQKAPTQEALL